MRSGRSPDPAKLCPSIWSQPLGATTVSRGGIDSMAKARCSHQQNIAGMCFRAGTLHFFDMGKVAGKTSQLNFHNLEYSGGIGFRFTLHNAVIMRIDNAVSREGYRFMWTFSNPWRDEERNENAF